MTARAGRYLTLAPIAFGTHVSGAPTRKGQASE